MKSLFLFLALSVPVAMMVGCGKPPNYRSHAGDAALGTETWYWMQRKPTTKSGVCAAMFGSDRPYHYAEDGRTKVPGVSWVIDWVDFDKQQLFERQFHSRKDAEDFAEQKCPTTKGKP